MLRFLWVAPAENELELTLDDRTCVKAGRNVVQQGPRHQHCGHAPQPHKPGTGCPARWWYINIHTICRKERYTYPAARNGRVHCVSRVGAWLHVRAGRPSFRQRLTAVVGWCAPAALSATCPAGRYVCKPCPALSVTAPSAHLPYTHHLLHARLCGRVLCQSPLWRSPRQGYGRPLTLCVRVCPLPTPLALARAFVATPHPAVVVLGDAEHDCVVPCHKFESDHLAV